jgi:hypothetical protein
MVQVIQALAVLFIVGFGFTKKKARVRKKDEPPRVLEEAKEGIGDR